YLGNFLLWVGVPLSIVTFLRGAKLSGLIWIAPLVAWAAILLGAGLAWAWVKYQSPKAVWPRSTQGSFLLTSMVGNTGYLGYPVVLAILGPQYFAWALFYDLLGTTLGAYGLGIGIAAYFGTGVGDGWQLVLKLIKNPPLWSFFVGICLRDLVLPSSAEQVLQVLAWTMVSLSLVLIGMRLTQLSSWKSLPKALLSLGIKMVLIPLTIGLSLTILGVEGPPRLALVLQMAMPPAFATLVISEVYGLDKDLTVTALAAGTAGLLLLLPGWVWLFAI
ncbi:MAG TPA: AEC family transporter, partial [Candidatus Caenarcaniphilales bacterium]